MKRKHVFKSLFPIGILVLFFSSCKEIDLTNISNEIKIDESLVLPIGSGSTSMAEVLSQYVNDGNLLIVGDTINYVDSFSYDYKFMDIDLFANTKSKQIEIPLAAANPLSANSTIPVSIGDQLIDFGLNSDPSSQRVDSTYVNTSSVGVTVSVSNITVASSGANISSSDLKVKLVFPTIYNQSNHTPVSMDITPYTFGTTYNLQLNNVIVNTDGRNVPVQVQLSTGTRAIKTTSSSTVNIGIVFNQINFKASYGFFKPTSVQATSIKVPLDMLESLPQGLKFANPKALINIQSNIGTWLDYNIDYVKSYSKDNSVTVNATFNGNTTAHEIIKAKPTAPGLFSSYDMKTLDKDYGTTNKLIGTSVKVDTLEYKFSLTPSASSPAPNFIIPNMEMKAKVKIQIPMYLEAGSTYNYTDTIEYNNDLDLSYIEKGILVAKITNGLPVKASLSLKMLDANMHAINSTLNDSTWVIEAGNVNAVGIVTSSTLTNLNINLSDTEMDDIKDAKYFVYTIVLAGQDVTKQIQFTKKDIIAIKLGIFATASKTTTIQTNNN